MHDSVVITACSVDLPVGADPDKGAQDQKMPFSDCSKHPWYSPRLKAKINDCTGSHLEIAFMPDDTRARPPFALKRRSSLLLAQNLTRLMKKAGVKQNAKKQRIGIANTLCYSFFNNEEKVNLFNFKANLEHQTPALVGGCLDCFGPQFVVKEGDNSDLICIDSLVAAMQYLPGPVIVSGISEPHPLLISAEVMSECKDVESASPREKVKINTRFTEGVASVFLEKAESAAERRCTPLARIAGSYQCMRNFDYTRPRAIEEHLKQSLEKVVKHSSGNIRAVFGCFRHNEKIHDIEMNVLSRLLPHASIINTAAFLGDVSPVSGLIDLYFAASGYQNNVLPGGRERSQNGETAQKLASLPFQGGEILIQKISRFGHYAGVVLGEAS